MTREPFGDGQPASDESLWRLTMWGTLRGRRGFITSPVNEQIAKPYLLTNEKRGWRGFTTTSVNEQIGKPYLLTNGWRGFTTPNEPTGKPSCWPMRIEAGEDLRYRQPIGKRYLLTNEMRGWRGREAWSTNEPTGKPYLLTNENRGWRRFTTPSANREALPVDQWDEKLARTWGMVNKWANREAQALPVDQWEERLARICDTVSQ